MEYKVYLCKDCFKVDVCVTARTWLYERSIFTFCSRVLFVLNMAGITAGSRNGRG